MAKRVDFTDVTPVILCGGTGSRLWPLSTSERPKQFQAVVGKATMLDATIERARDLGVGGSPILVGNAQHRKELMGALRRHDGTALLEPVGRNTAAAVALSALVAEESGAPSVLLIMPADHHVGDLAAMRRALASAVAGARKGKIVTLGIVPDRAATEYGWITPASGQSGLCPIERFVEKPNLAAAEALFGEERHLWNAGIFIARSDVLLSEFESVAPDVLAGARLALAEATTDDGVTELPAERFQEIPSVPFDVAVMERTRLGAVVPANMQWSDVGAWDAVWRISDKDQRGNVSVGNVALLGTNGSFVRTSGRKVAVLGLQNVVVVETDDAILVSSKEEVQQVKEVSALVARAASASATGTPVFEVESTRPWGAYRSLDRGETFHVKHITVAPGGRLSLQYHFHRAEHWIVVSGLATVEIDGVEQVVRPNGNVFIPKGSTHRLTNRGDEPVHLIEIQFGDYFGEDDIVRLEDIYGRAPEALTPVAGAPASALA